MNSASPHFSSILEQENDPFDPSQTDYTMALLGIFPFPDQTEISLPDSTPAPFSLHDFSEQYPFQMDLSPSPEIYSPLSLPSTPLSSADEFADVGAVDASTPYNSDLSPGGLSVHLPLVDVDEAKHAKPDLDGFEHDSVTRKWVCTKCGSDFVSTHEARRHVKTAAKCTGKKVTCLRCGDRIHAAAWSRKRHFTSKKCQKKGRKRGAPAYTVNTAYEEDEEL